MGFDWAIKQLRRGKHVRRTGWNGKNMHVWLSTNNLCLVSKDGVLSNESAEPCIMMFTARQTRIAWLASQADMLADDWVLA